MPTASSTRSQSPAIGSPAGVRAPPPPRPGGAPAPASAPRGAAPALWRGEPLADVAGHRFAGHEVARLEELRAVATEERIEADLPLARHHDLIAELTALAATDPPRERLYAQLMLALYRAGRQT